MKDGYLYSMLERCSVSDNTGTCRLTLWGTPIQEVANHKSYSITDVRVKIFNSIKYLTSTPLQDLTDVREITVQPLSSCHLKGSVRIQVQPDDNAEPIWLKVLTSTLKMLEHISSDVTLQSPEEQVFAQLFLLKNFFC
ncbi:uncharacterized protein [Porites lutea]|uniref:uncharacterized protein n=1 Tax=Porites lutea TaxID=51062 RepID=UPI003CC6790F